MTEAKIAEKREHIFPATVITEKTATWKRLKLEGREAEAQDVLVDIIEQSTQMFERLAQYEQFDHTVDLPSLVTVAQARMPKWLDAWDPQKTGANGIFSWLSKCARNAFLSEVSRASQHRKRFYATSDNLEKFVGTEDHSVEKKEAAAAIRDKINAITSRWGDTQINECIKFQIECIIENASCDKKVVIQASSYASGVSPDTSKFLYTWSLIALRDAMHQRLAPNFSEQDIFRLTNSFTYIPDMLNVITWQQMSKLITLFGGLRIKLPTITQLIKAKKDYQVYRDIDDSNLDPKSVETTAKKHKVSPKSAQEIFEQMSHDISHTRDGEFPVFEE